MNVLIMKEAIGSNQLYGDVSVQEVEVIRTIVHETQNNDALKRIFFSPESKNTSVLLRAFKNHDQYLDLASKTELVLLPPKTLRK